MKDQEYLLGDAFEHKDTPKKKLYVNEYGYARLFTTCPLTDVALRCQIPHANETER